MKRKITLTPRDHLILEHLATFEVSTKSILRSAFYEGQRMAAVVSTQRRLDSRGIGYLYGYNLPNSRTLCFRLTKRGGDYLGIKVDTQPIAVLRLFSLIGRLYFINRPLPGKQRALCTNEMLNRFIASDDLDRGKIRPPRVDFYVSQNKIEDPGNSELALGAILPDLNSSVRRIADRCINHSRGFIEKGWFADVMRAGRFEWTILTGHEAKKEELQRAVTRKLRRRLAMTYFKYGLDSGEAPPIRVNVEVIPELANLRLLNNKKKAISDSPTSVPRPRKSNRRR